MSATTKDYPPKFWALIDEVLDAVLFLLIGPGGRAATRSKALANFVLPY